MNSRTMGIQGKLYFLMGTVLFVFLGTIFYANNNVQKITYQVELLGHERLPLSQNIADLRTYSHAVPRYLWVAIANEKGSKGRAEALKKVNEYMDKFNISDDKYKEFLGLTDKSKELFSNINKDIQNVDVVCKKIQDYLMSAKNEDAIAKKIMLEEMRPLTNSITEDARELTTISSEKNTKIVAAASEEASSSQKSILIISTIVCISLIIFGYFFARSLVSTLSRITEAVGGASEQVASASVQISGGAEALSTAAQEQASSLEETSASLTEIAGMANSNVKGAEEADRSAQEVFKITEETRKLMEELTTAMSSILTSNERIVKLVKIIEEIGEKTEIIDDIVFKTQLLSFNASVEAERAGEHGRGFAVVAQEVGNLAQMSGKAAAEISLIVKNSIKEAESVAIENKERVEFGSDLAVSTKEKMESVLSKLSGVIESVSKITAASREQSQGVDQITNAIETLNQSTQETAGTAEESASASTELTGQAQSLMGLVEELKNIVNGSSNKNSHYEAPKVLMPQHTTNKSSFSNVVTMKKKTKMASPAKYADTSRNEVKMASGDAWDKL